MSPDASAYRQPRLLPSGAPIQGTDLTDDLAAILSLEEEAMPARRSLINLSSWLRSTVTVGRPAPAVEAIGERIRKPVPGDLVVESSTMGWTRRREHPSGTGDWYRAVGVLLLHRDEWAQTDAEYAAELAGEGDINGDWRAQDHAWYVQYGPAAVDVCRWINCDFLMIPWADDVWDLTI